MSKHVCPYCENIHMDVNYLSVKLSGHVYELPGLKCPQCGAEIFLAQEIRNFLNSQTAKMISEKTIEFR